MKDTEIHFTNIPTPITLKQFEMYLHKLPLNEQSRVLQYRNWHDQCLCLLGIALIVRFVLGGDISKLKNVKTNDFGKPYTNMGAFFNISHAGDFIVLAVSSEYELGIDLEKIEAVSLSDFRCQMTEMEWKRISDTMPYSAKVFYDYWTQKEAVAKAVGHGLSIPFLSFEVINYKTVINNRTYYLKEFDINPQYSGHIATTDAQLNISPPLFIENRQLIS